VGVVAEPVAELVDFAMDDQTAAPVALVGQVAAREAELAAGIAAVLDPGFGAVELVAAIDPVAAADLVERPQSRLEKAPELPRTPLETPIQTFVGLLGKISWSSPRPGAQPRFYPRPSHS
jgi:hypothetical protein